MIKSDYIQAIEYTFNYINIIVKEKNISHSFQNKYITELM